ncbi:HAMP domain-containing sensor histidine kinase [uncultured Sulfitobacter sp.]|uniref:sensor histidine kinase n=1 Tax=uncultured Sulfitobacter sp. TaxID=191468 RepID=UPI002626EDCE|nr:HAMP domain-containing sensor histidine kinase [uncultured Sulfitobacter sp.]
MKKRSVLPVAAALFGGVSLGALGYVLGQALFPVGAIPLMMALVPAAGLPALLFCGKARSDGPTMDALQALPDEVWLIDVESGRVQYLNAAASTRIGADLNLRPDLRVDDIFPNSQPAVLRGLLVRTDQSALPDVRIATSTFRPRIKQLDDGRTVMLMLQDVTQAVEEERAKADFISTVSHELRSPLTSIKGSMGLLLSNAAGELPTPARNLLEIAHRNAERLVLIINDILDLQKIVDGGMDFEKRPVDAAALVHEALDASSLFMQRFDLTIDVVGAEGPVEIMSDPNRIIQVLGNLLTNAAKFSRPHSTVTITLTQTPECIKIVVRDQGAGIPQDEQCKIFDRFTDMSNSDRQQKGGSGLGLSICKAIVDSLDGSIGFESVEGVGTAFHIILPRGSAHQHGENRANDMRNAG